MKNIFIFLSVSLAVLTVFFHSESPETDPSASVSEKYNNGPQVIVETVQKGDTLESIFSRSGFTPLELNGVYRSAVRVYDLSNISAGEMFLFEVNRKTGALLALEFGIDPYSLLRIEKKDGSYDALKVSLPVETKTAAFYIKIRDNLISSMPGLQSDYMKMALQLSDIFAWDLDFSSDLRKGDSVRFLVEERWVGNAFRGFGDILAAEFTNNGKVMRAYRYAIDGRPSYFDEHGRSVRKTLLRSPLRFKYISSGFRKRRLHPVLRIYRPHLGVDYAAPPGTPVSAAGDGKVLFAGYKGQNGKMIKISHPGGYITYYGHLSRIARKIRRGAKVSQGDIIGYVGATGLATGPHLDYRIKYRGRFVNPLKVRLPRGKLVPSRMMANYRDVMADLDRMMDTMGSGMYVRRDAGGPQG
jgi:murein DD-endopeptidase MepM/ murein hydrolase activator NlpD